MLTINADGHEVQVMEPTELRDKLIAEINQIQSLYAWCKHLRKQIDDSTKSHTI